MRGVVALLALAILAIPALGQYQPVAAPGVGHVERTDLTEAGSLEGAQRVLRFVQVSDAHILDDDAPYPLRQEPLDPFITAFSTSAQRPQDEYTDEVLDSIVRGINQQHADDAFQFVLNTGDNIDNDLENELMRFLDLWDGTSTTTGPLSGLQCVPDGQSTGLDDTTHDVTDQCTSLPASLLANRTALAPGLPWYSAFGNHDTLIQGNVNPNPVFDAIAGSFGRKLLLQPDYVALHFRDGPPCSGGTEADDFGHGYGLAGERLCDANPDNDGYYAFDVNGVRFVVLDTINDDFATANGFAQQFLNTESLVGADIIGGYAEGAVDPAQLAWLRNEVATNGDKLLVVVSHHTVNSMFTNLADGSCAPGLGCLKDVLDAAGYGTGEGLTAELSQSPNVVAWMGGHTHQHRIEPKGADAHGFWNIESSSLIDWPQEARVVELWVTADGAKGAWVLTSFGHDFQPSKDLELTDPQRVPGAAGDPDDQDVILWFDVPAGVQLTPQPVQPRQWSLRMADPASNATPAAGQVGVPFNVTFTLRDLAGRTLPSTLQAQWTVTHQPSGGQELSAMDAEGPLSVEIAADGLSAVLRGHFTPPDATTYYATVTWGVPMRDGDALGFDDVGSQMVSLSVEGPSITLKDGKQTPTPALLAFAAVAAALGLAAARRR